MANLYAAVAFAVTVTVVGVTWWIYRRLLANEERKAAIAYERRCAMEERRPVTVEDIRASLARRYEP
jgi:hypothetical protein